MHPNTTHTHTGWVADVDAGMHPSVESRARLACTPSIPASTCKPKGGACQAAPLVAMYEYFLIIVQTCL
jgi:hypothetical protein